MEKVALIGAKVNGSITVPNVVLVGAMVVPNVGENIPDASGCTTPGARVETGTPRGTADEVEKNGVETPGARTGVVVGGGGNVTATTGVLPNTVAPRASAMLVIPRPLPIGASRLAAPFERLIRLRKEIPEP